MPRVNGKKYPYTKAGRAAAKKAAKKTAKKAPKKTGKFADTKFGQRIMAKKDKMKKVSRPKQQRRRISPSD